MKSMAGNLLHFEFCSYTFFSVTKFDEKGHVVDAGMDLNDPSAFGEYCKDAVILSVIIQVVTFDYL